MRNTIGTAKKSIRNNQRPLTITKYRNNFKRDRVLLALATAGDIALGVLYKIVSFPMALAEVHASVAQYGSSGNIPDYSLSDFGCSGLFRDMAEMSIYIAGLKRQGLVIQKAQGYAKITEKGRSVVQYSLSVPSYARRYEIIKGAPRILTMVIFDILEKEHQKRDWLRFQLKSLKFRYVQGSVWIGEHPLPDQLLHDLKKYDLLRCVHIFSIDRSGTISDLLNKFGF